MADAARAAALAVVRAVRERDAYANLALPAVLIERRITGRDAALATELAYGTCRAAGVLDEIIAVCASRPVDPPVRDILQLGAYQLLRTRIPAHAAVSATVELARADGRHRAAGFVNAILRRIAAKDWTVWTDELGSGRDELTRLALRYAHPAWIAAAFHAALGGDIAETQAALAADDARPATHLAAWPGAIERAELAAATGGAPGPYSPYAVRLDGGAPGEIEAVRDGRAGVQDEGSQVCAIELTQVEMTGPDERWLDMCAGPGGKAALLAALAAQRGARLTAIELREHRAELVRRATRRWDVEVRVADATELSGGGYDRVLLDAPCTGLGALRRRPEARWRRTETDLADLTALQGRLLAAAYRLVRPGGVIGYVTCSPHLAETRDVVAGRAVERTVQLWPHRHGTDAMFVAILRGR